MTKLLATPHVKSMVLAMVDARLQVQANWKDGTVIAKHGETEVFRALQKGKNQPWIVRHVNNLFS